MTFSRTHSVYLVGPKRHKCLEVKVAGGIQLTYAAEHKRILVLFLLNKEPFSFPTLQKLLLTQIVKLLST